MHFVKAVGIKQVSSKLKSKWYLSAKKIVFSKRYFHSVQLLSTKFQLTQHLFNLHSKFESKVVICEPKTIKQKSADGKADVVNGYNVVLEDTILFPEGGGQVSICMHFSSKITAKSENFQ